MCLSLEHQNPSKTSEKMGYFDRVTVSLVVSLHILWTANQETEGSQDRLIVQNTEIVHFFTRHFVQQEKYCVSRTRIVYL